MIWLNVFIIAIAFSPLIYVFMVLYVKALIFIGRRTKKNIKLALSWSVCIMFLPIILGPLMVLLELGDLKTNNGWDFDSWAFVIWVAITYALCLTPSILYMYKKRLPHLEKLGYCDV